MTLQPEHFEVDELDAALEAANLLNQATSDRPEVEDPNPIQSMNSKEMPVDDMPTIVLPMQLSMLEDAARTDVGQQREHNEDFFSLSTEMSKAERPSGRFVQGRGLYVLCDGMGGHAGGEVASQLAVDTLQTFFRAYWASDEGEQVSRMGQLPPSTIIREGVRLANQSIFERNQTDARMGNGRMGTTLVVVLLCNTSVAIAHVGDSRAYRYTRKRGLQQVTVDHEVGQREIQRGVDPEVAYGRPDAYQLTQALGPRDENFVEPDLTFMELTEDTLLLLASDGLTDNNLLENHVMSHVDPMMSSQMNLDQGVRQLVDLANEVNGHDNITVIAVRAKVRPNLEQLR
jgi:protein phosphatase